MSEPLLESHPPDHQTASPVTWLPWIADSIKTYFKPEVFTIYLVVKILVNYWQEKVAKIIPEPYLDEIFHIPQAQAYCRGDYGVWDPKLTTPPGLYAFSIFFAKFPGQELCDVYTLRRLNTWVLMFIMSLATSCLGLLTRIRSRNPSLSTGQRSKKTESFRHLHTAANIALFPPLFFFSGLYYTDVLSTCVVLIAYRLFLSRKGAYNNSGQGLFQQYLMGMVALTMRQTNIFWVAVFMGGLEAVRTIRSIKSGPIKEEPEPRTVQGNMILRFNRYSRGEIHDVSLANAGVHDFALCAFSIAIATLYHPILILTRLWPYIALLVSFASFVLWNGGVVLGDKSNHVATIHLPQMLYIWAFIAFFSFPLFIPSLMALTKSILTLPNLIMTSHSSKQVFKVLLVGIYTTIALLATLIVIKYNTIIHPFTLADNRHYVFYVFRYTILRHPLIRYILAPIYLLCFYLAYSILAGPSPAITFKPSNSKTTPRSRVLDRKQEIQKEGPTTSFFLILLLSTALSLITAPLVEPRYFIIPWLFWRLHILSPSPETKRRGSIDYILLVETVWFLAINAVTGYVFLHRGFEWAQQEGKVQRFIW